MIGYAFCGSFCTHRTSLEILRVLVERGISIQPIMSASVYSTDTRFGSAKTLREEVKRLTGREIIHEIVDAEPLGPAHPLDALVISPCTGNTLAKIAGGITDSSVTMAAKAHLRCDRPLLLALASNDSLSGNLQNIATLLLRKGVFFVPMLQDDPTRKPHSLVADFSLLPECLDAALEGKQKRPFFLS